MAEVTNADENKRQVEPVRGPDDGIMANRAAGLNNGGDAHLGSYLNGVCFYSL